MMRGILKALALWLLAGSALAATPTYQAVVGSAVADGGSTTYETATLTPAGSNRLILCVVHSSDGTVQNVSQVKFGSTAGTGGIALTQVGSHVSTGSFARSSMWRTTTEPAASAGTIWVEWAGAQGERLVICGAFSDVDIAGTPLGTAASAAASGNNPHTLASIGAVADDLVVDFITYLDGAAGVGNVPAPASSQTERIEVVSTGTSYAKGAMGTLAATTTSETRSWTVNNNPSVDRVVWAVALKYGTGGGGADPPAITDVDGDDTITSDQADIVITGTDFDTATVDIEQGAVSVAQSIDSQDADEIQFDATFDTGGDDLKHGAATLRVTNDDDQDDTIAITINAPSGHLYVDIATPETEGDDRITAVDDIETGDQLQVRGVGGGSVPAGLQIFDDGTFGFEEGNTPASFDARVWDVNDATWGSWATQSVTSGSSVVPIILQQFAANDPEYSTPVAMNSR